MHLLAVIGLIFLVGFGLDKLMKTIERKIEERRK